MGKWELTRMGMERTGMVRCQNGCGDHSGDSDGTTERASMKEFQSAQCH